MTTLWQDLLYGFRVLLKKPGFTAVAALSLALGIGANAVIFSLIDTTLLRPLPFPDAGRLMIVWSVPQQKPDQRNNPNVSSFSAFRDRNQSFEELGAINGGVTNIAAEQDGAPAERINGWLFAPSIFKALGVQPQLGRLYNDAEDQVENPAPVVVLSHRFWETHFNSDPNIVGKTMTMDKVPNTIIGVMPKGFVFFQDDFDYYAPLPINRTQSLSKQGFLLVVGRLKPGVTVKRAQAELSAIAAQLAASDPERNQGNGATVQTLQEAAYGGLRNPLLTLEGAVAFVLLIGCANVAGLLLARAAKRKTEVSLRAALGAGRGRIVRQLLTESVLLALLGGLLGVGLGWAGLRLFVGSAPPGFPRLNELRLDGETLAFTAAIAILTGLLFGIVPSLQASKTDLASSLKESGRSGTEGVARQYLRSIMVTVQIAMALVLLIGAGLMINSFVRAESTNLNADPKGLLTFEFRFPQGEAIKPFARYRGLGLWDVSPLTTLTYTRVLERVQNLPGVLSAAGINRPPLGGGGGIPMSFLIAGRPAPSANPNAPQESPQSANYFAVTPKFFSTMRIPLIRGREFTDQDTAAGSRVIVINQSLARRFFPNEDPMGERITLDFVPDEPVRQIVGIVADTPLNRFQKEQAPIVYVPYTQQTPRWIGPFWNDRAAMTFVLRTSGDPLSLIPAVRRAVADVDRNKPAANFRTVEQNLDQQVQYVRLYVLLLSVFGGIAAVLAAVGIYGVMSYSVAERTREIGIRIALGASGRDVLVLVIRHALVLVGIGLAIGLLGSFALTRLIKSALFGVSATDPATYIGVSLFLTMIALAASIVPTRKAVVVDPTIALRYE